MRELRCLGGIYEVIIREKVVALCVIESQAAQLLEDNVLGAELLCPEHRASDESLFFRLFGGLERGREGKWQTVERFAATGWVEGEA